MFVCLPIEMLPNVSMRHVMTIFQDFRYGFCCCCCCYQVKIFPWVVMEVVRQLWSLLFTEQDSFDSFLRMMNNRVAQSVDYGMPFHHDAKKDNIKLKKKTFLTTNEKIAA